MAQKYQRYGTTYRIEAHTIKKETFIIGGEAENESEISRVIGESR